jgi:hypothetical protein
VRFLAPFAGPVTCAGKFFSGRENFLEGRGMNGGGAAFI